MKTVEEIFNKIPHLGRDGHYFHMSQSGVVKAMEEYATSKSKEDNLSLMEEIEKLKTENKGLFGVIESCKQTKDALLFQLEQTKKFVNNAPNEVIEGLNIVIKGKESQLAEAKKEIEELQYINIDLKAAFVKGDELARKLMFDDEPSDYQLLQSQLQESEERNEQMVEALQQLLKVSEIMEYGDTAEFIKSALSFKDNNKKPKLNAWGNPIDSGIDFTKNAGPRD